MSPVSHLCPQAGGGVACLPFFQTVGASPRAPPLCGGGSIVGSDRLNVPMWAISGLFFMPLHTAGVVQ